MAVSGVPYCPHHAYFQAGSEVCWVAGHRPHNEEQLQGAGAAADVCWDGNAHLWQSLLFCWEGCWGFFIHLNTSVNVVGYSNTYQCKLTLYGRIMNKSWNIEGGIWWSQPFNSLWKVGWVCVRCGRCTSHGFAYSHCCGEFCSFLWWSKAAAGRDDYKKYQTQYQTLFSSWCKRRKKLPEQLLYMPMLP